MTDRRTRGGHESGDTPVSELLVPEVLFRPGLGMAAPEPQDAAPRVPDLPCTKCGELDTMMRFCSGQYTLHWGSCDAKGDAEHFHRECPRCKHRWTTYDVLADQ